MFCEAYNQSLMDAAAAGEQLSPALQQHLASCDACRTAFAEEQSLFAAIDSGLRAAANSEVPTTLIPRVHVAINNEPAPQPSFQKWIFASAALACALVVAITLQLRHRDAPVPVKTATAKSSAPTSPRPMNAFPSIPPAAHETPRQSNKAETTHPSSPNANASITVEVLVPDEERVALAKFMRHFADNNRVLLAYANPRVDMLSEIPTLDPVEFGNFNPGFSSGSKDERQPD